MYHCHEPGSTFSMQFSYTAGLFRISYHLHILFSSWKNPCCLASWLLCSSAFWWPHGFHGIRSHISLSSRVHYWAQCFSCSLRRAEHRDCSFWPLLSHDLLMEPPAWGWTPSSSLVHQDPRSAFHKAVSPPVCAQDLQLHQLSSVPTAGFNCVRFLSSLQFMSTALLLSGNKK